MSSLLQQISPPILWNLLAAIKKSLRAEKKPYLSISPDKQDLHLYWDAEMAKLLDTWGEGTVWSEVQFLMANSKGKVLDIACGTGKTIEIVSKFPNIELYGIDISDLLISKALERGILSDRLKVGDATNTGYADNEFKYAYSIGSLEHFTESGILQFVSESHRVTDIASFHMIPVSRSGKDEGWIKTSQSYYNNSVNWWLTRFHSSHANVCVIDSSWQDDISFGKWFVCYK